MVGTTWNDLPTEIHVHILEYAGVKELVRFREVSRVSKDLVDTFLTTRLLRLGFPLAAARLDSEVAYRDCQDTPKQRLDAAVRLSMSIYNRRYRRHSVIHCCDPPNPSTTHTSSRYPFPKCQQNFQHCAVTRPDRKSLFLIHLRSHYTQDIVMDSGKSVHDFFLEETSLFIITTSITVEGHFDHKLLQYNLQGNVVDLKEVADLGTRVPFWLLANQHFVIVTCPSRSQPGVDDCLLHRYESMMGEGINSLQLIETIEMSRERKPAMDDRYFYQIDADRLLVRAFDLFDGGCCEFSMKLTCDLSYDNMEFNLVILDRHVYLCHGQDILYIHASVFARGRLIGLSPELSRLHCESRTNFQSSSLFANELSYSIQYSPGGHSLYSFQYVPRWQSCILPDANALVIHESLPDDEDHEPDLFGFLGVSENHGRNLDCGRLRPREASTPLPPKTSRVHVCGNHEFTMVVAENTKYLVIIEW